MLKRVHDRRPTYNNTADVSGSLLKTTIKTLCVSRRAMLLAMLM